MTKLHITPSIALLTLAGAACATADMPLDEDGGGTTADARESADARITFDAAPAPDAGPTFDAGTGPDGDVPGAPDAATTAYRHTMTMNGVNEFDTGAEQFSTTSNGYSAFVSWDDDNLYLAYDGPDIATGDANKWVLFYIDIDPGMDTGPDVGELYNTQQPGFPAGFGPEYYYRWRASGDFYDLQRYDTGEWVADTSNQTVPAHSGQYVELSIPLADLGATAPAGVGVIAFMLNETAFLEAAYAGLYSTSFTDGYYDSSVGPIPVGAYLEADFASPSVPNDPANQIP